MHCSNSRYLSASRPVAARPSTEIRRARASVASRIGLDSRLRVHQAPPRGSGHALVCRAQKLAGGVFEAAVPEELREKVSPKPPKTAGDAPDASGPLGFLSQALELPQLPGYPRTVTQVIAFSVPTGLVWYGWYKFCVEEELQAYEESVAPGSGQGYGGYGTLGPFVFGLALGPLAAALELPGGEAWAAAGVIWIYYTQYMLYKRVNDLYAADGKPLPLTIWWLVAPGFNLIIGLRQLYFLAAYFAEKRGDQVGDPVAEFFPFISVPTLGWKEFLRKPALWAAPLKDVKDLPFEWLQE